MLKAEILLWGCKVRPIGGANVYSKDVSADLTAAKQALQDVIDSEKYGFASTTSFADVFDVAKKDYKEMKRSCDKMSNHFATAPFVLIYSIRRLSNTFIYLCYLKT